MDSNDIKIIIFDAIEMTNHSREDDDQIPISEETELYGTNGHLDSMGLVGFLIDVEESLLDQGQEVSLSDERAMSQKNSPFQNVQSLVNYIDSVIRDA